jgi:putative SOS response-associated peptidase YedK
MTEIHNVKHRMPAILAREDRDTWLSGEHEDAFRAIKQYPDTHMLALHSAHRLTHFRVITASDDGLEAISAS